MARRDVSTEARALEATLFAGLAKSVPRCCGVSLLNMNTEVRGRLAEVVRGRLAVVWLWEARGGGLNKISAFRAAAM